MPPLRAVIGDLGLSAKKSLGQNFLLDLNITRKIARAAGPATLTIEVGPGPGGLTRALLLEGAGDVVAIERDERCRPALEQIAERHPDRLTVIEADALTVDFAALTDGRPTAVAANLPYNIGTELLVRWLRGEPKTEIWPSWWTSLTLMFQREVAQRIVARPGDKAYGRLAVLTTWRAQAEILFDLPPQAFTPPPKVSSSVVRLTPRSEPQAPARLKALETVTAQAFGQRRKMLRGGLKGLGVDVVTLLDAAGVSPTARPEEIDVEGFCALARAYDALSGSKAETAAGDAPLS